MFKKWVLSKPLRDEIYRYARFPPTGVSLRQMVQFGPDPSPGSLFHASQFVVEELPIRLAHRVKELEELPHDLNKDESILLVRDWYAQSFEELTTLPKPEISSELKTLLYGENGGHNNLYNLNTHRNAYSAGASEEPSSLLIDDDGLVIPRRHHHPQQQPSLDQDQIDHQKIAKSKSYYMSCPKNVTYPAEVYNYNKLVTDTLTKIKKRHDATVATIAKGVQNWKRSTNYSYLDTSIQGFLDRFYMSRIGIRMLIGQQIAIARQAGNSNASRGYSNEEYVGIICLNTNICDIAQDAIDSARFTCEEHYGLMESPKVQFYCPKDINFMYVPGHLVHMIFETLKNSLRATIEHSIRMNPGVSVEDINFPPIKIIVAEGEEDITIKISDEGGGIARSAIPLIWNYLYTTVESTPDIYDEDDPDLNQFKTDFKAPMAGYGYGLPISRLYARYFGGDLKLISMEGYGTDVYLHLNRLSSSSEPLA